MASFLDGPTPHPKLQNASAPNRASHWHPYASPSAPASSSERHSYPPVRTSAIEEQMSSASYQIMKRAAVTACDSCRLRKLKCNAKDLPRGVACSGCYKQGIECTFDDRDANVKKRPTLPHASLAHGRSRKYGQTSSAQLRESGDNTPRSSQSREKFCDSSPNETRYEPERHRNDEGVASCTKGSWGHEEAGLVLASINSSTRLPQDPLAWDRWNIPLFLTDVKTGQRRSYSSQAVVELLLHRFYAQPSFNCIVVSHHAEMLRRLRYGAIPVHLLHTMVACATASSMTTEPELLLWRSQIWHGASESVFYRLNIRGSPELELVQSLLLLSSNWPGGLLQTERVNLFYTAINLALSLQLHSGDHLHVTPGPRSSRIMLFWSFYCADKILSVMTKRPPVLCRESHSTPLPSLEDIEAAIGLPPKTNVAAWLQRLAYAYIALIQITECVLRQLILPIREGKISSLEQIYRQILPIEKQLEDFCKEQRWLLGIVTELSPLCRSLAEAVISQLHFTQLHLYLPALQFDVDWRRSRSQALNFSAENDKPLAATIESAWHLIQQPVNGTPFNLDTSSPASSNDAALTFTQACVLIGKNFFKFLSTNWSEWDQGKGCIRYAPIQLSPQFLQEIDPDMQTGHGDRKPLQESDANRHPQCNEESGSAHRPQLREDQVPVKRQEAISRRRKLSPLHIVQPHRNIEVDRPASDNDSESTLTSVAVSTPARELFKDQQSPQKKSQQADKQSYELGLATLNSRAMLTPIRADVLYAIQEQETSQEEESQLAEALG